MPRLPVARSLSRLGPVALLWLLQASACSLPSDPFANPECEEAADCDDGLECTIDRCVSGQCQLENLPVDTPCSGAGDICADSRCDDQGSCRQEPVPGRTCDDGNACTSGDLCDKDGRCVGSAAPGAGCSDGNPCTGPDACDAQAQCSGPALPDEPCDDGNGCTEGDRCDAAGQCAPGSPVSDSQTCDDDDACTADDQCQPDGSCIGTAIDIPEKQCEVCSCDAWSGIQCEPAPISGECPCGLFGRIRYVDAFEDFKVQFVDSFPQLEVEIIESFSADEPGEWEEVESFEDFTVRIVDSFPDITVKIVDYPSTCD